MKIILKIALILSLYIPSCLAKEKITLNYNAYAGGVNGFELSSVITIDGDNYIMESKAKTKGLIGFFYPSTSSYKTVGKINNGDLLVNSYEAIKIVREKERKNLITYNAIGMPIKKEYTKYGKTTVTDMKNFEKLAKDAVDYQSMLLALYYDAKQTNKCDTKISIFNGKERKTLLFKDNDMIDMEKDGYSVFGGKAKECLLTVDEETLKDEDIAWLFKDDGDVEQKPMKVWLTDSYDTSFPIMVGAELGSIGYGKIYIFLDKIEINKN